VLGDGTIGQRRGRWFDQGCDVGMSVSLPRSSGYGTATANRLTPTTSGQIAHRNVRCRGAPSPEAGQQRSLDCLPDSGRSAWQIKFLASTVRFFAATNSCVVFRVRLAAPHLLWFGSKFGESLKKDGFHFNFAIQDIHGKFQTVVHFSLKMFRFGSLQGGMRMFQ
jgi:hypothetical protein